MKRYKWLVVSLGLLQSSWSETPPNILFILADDLGYGDVGCYNPDSRIPTPNLDRLAKEGMRFTDAHSPATVCTPTRYSLLTGRMCFRTGRSRVFSGVGGPCLIEEGRLTLPQMLKNEGYATAMFGKWHLGMSFFDQEGKRIEKQGLQAVEMIDFSRDIGGSPVDYGFDQFYGTACCPTTDWLYAYIDGRRIPVPPVKPIDKSKLPKHPYANDCRGGLIAPDFELSEVDLVFLKKSQEFLKERAMDPMGKPFFLFHSMQAVHLPSFPAEQFQGKSGRGPHGDFIYQMDWTVGELMRSLEELGFADNTIVMFGSDNGPEVPTVIAMRRDHQHDGAFPWRGVKRDQWEGGHRTPFIVKWPGMVRPGSESHEIVSLSDVFATCAAISGVSIPKNAGEDSFDLTETLKGVTLEKPLRPYLLQQTFAMKLSIRKGDWKYIDHQGSGGNNYEKSGEWGMGQFAIPDTDPEAPGQLFNLADDPGETKNLYSKYPGKVAELKGLLEESKASGRTEN